MRYVPLSVWLTAIRDVGARSLTGTADGIGGVLTPGGNTAVRAVEKSAATRSSDYCEKRVSRLVSDRGRGSRASSAWLLVTGRTAKPRGRHRGSRGDSGDAVELVAVVGDEVDQYPHARREVGEHSGVRRVELGAARSMKRIVPTSRTAEPLSGPSAIAVPNDSASPLEPWLRAMCRIALDRSPSAEFYSAIDRSNS
jgi:hypothetical protein